MEPDSKIRMGEPLGSVSVRAGMRPLGLISRNQGSFWACVARSTWWTL